MFRTVTEVATTAAVDPSAAATDFAMNVALATVPLKRVAVAGAATPIASALDTAPRCVLTSSSSR